MLLKVHITSISGLQSKNNRSICATFRGDRRESNCQSNVLNEFVHELFTWDLKSPLTEEDVLRIDLCEKMFLRTKLIGKYTLCLSQVEKQGFQAVNDSLINENNLSIPYRLCFEVTYIKENWEPLSPKTSSIINICSLYSLANYLWCGKAPSLKNSEEDFSEEKKKFSNEVTAKYGATMDQPVYSNSYQNGGEYQ